MTRERIIEELTERGYKAVPFDTVKNGVPFEGINIFTRIDTAMTIYTKPLIEWANLEGKNLADVVKRIISIYNENKDREFDREKIFSREFVLDNILVGVQKSGEEKLVKKETDFLGIESYLYIRIEEDATMKILPEHLKKMNITEEEAWEHGWKNTFAETDIIPMSSIFKFEDVVPDSEELYIISNRSQVRGASAIFNKKAIQQLSMKVGIYKWIVLPSSIHEMMLTPYCDKDKLLHCSRVVEEINEVSVAPEERLTNGAYLMEVYC